MTTEQDCITHTIIKAAVEAAGAAGQAMAAMRKDNNDRMQNVVPRISGSIMKQPTFNLEAEDKGSKLKIIIQNVINIFESYKGAKRKNSNKKELAR